MNYRYLTGMLALRLALEFDPDLPFIITTGSMNEETAVECMKAGATDYVIKEHITRLPFAVREALEKRKIRFKKEQAEEAWMEEHNLLQALMDNIPDVIYFKDRNSRFIRISHSQVKRLGLSDTNEAIGKTDFDFFTEQHAQAAYEDEQTIIRTGIPIIAKEEKETWPDGHISWVSSTKLPLRNTIGEIVGTFGISRDITQRKWAQEALRESEERFESFFENAADAILLTTPDGRIFAANSAACNIFGWTEAEIIAGGRELLVDMTDPRLIPALKKCAEVGKVQVDLTFNRKDGRKFEGELTSAIYLDKDGNQKTTMIIRDITERKQVENELKKSQERMNMVLDSTKMGIWNLELMTNLTWRTLRHDQIYGYDSLLPKWGLENFIEYVVPEDRQHVKDYFEQAFISNEINIEYQILRVDQVRRWVSLQGSVYKNEAGEVVHMLGTIADTTDRKHTELSLQKRIKELETVNKLATTINIGDNVQSLLQYFLDETLKTINATVGAILLYDPLVNKLKWSATRGWFEKLAGMPLDPHEGISGYVYSNNESHAFQDMKNDPLVSKRFLDFIPGAWSGIALPIQCKEGTIGVLYITVPLPKIISENETRLLAIISQLMASAILRARLDAQLIVTNQELRNEVDQRTAIQKLLETEKELLNITLMSINEGVIAMDQEGLVILVNHMAEGLIGYDLPEILDQPIEKIFNISDTETNQTLTNVVDVFYEINQKENRTHRKLTLTSKYGERILVDGSISSIWNINNQLIGHVIVFQDVTEKQKYEAQMMLSQKMEAIGQLAAGIAHEINTPIQYIGDNLRFLQKTISRFTELLDAYQNLTIEREKSLSSEDLATIETIKQQNKIQHYIDEGPNAIQEALDGVERVRKIVLAMREFSHPSEKEKKFANINHGIETTVVISRNEWKYCAELEMDLDPDLPPVNCQIDEINQVILNMVVNAAQSIQEKIPAGSEQKGKISISTRKDEDKILIFIQDTGKGIPEAIQTRIFDPFFTTKGIGKGTGQGLSMSHNIIVNKHQGRIRVDSAEGQGATFIIELPIDSKGG